MAPRGRRRRLESSSERFPVRSDGRDRKYMGQGEQQNTVYISVLYLFNLFISVEANQMIAEGCVIRDSFRGHNNN